MTRKQSRVFVVAICLFLLQLNYWVAAASPVASVQTITGPLSVQRGVRGSLVTVAARHASLNVGDFVQTAGASRATLLFSDGSQIKLDYNTRVEITTPVTLRSGKKSLFRVIRGQVYGRLRPGQGAQTVSASLVVEGTEFNLAVSDDGVATLTVINGQVEFFNPFGSVLVGNSQQSIARPGAAPTTPVTIANTGLIIEWTLDLSRAVVPREQFFVSLQRQTVRESLAIRGARARAVDDASTHRDYGDALFDARDYAAALLQYQVAERRRPGDAGTLQRMGDTLLALDRLDDAEATYRRALALASIPTVVQVQLDTAANTADESAQQQSACVLGLSWVELTRNRLVEAERLARQAIALKSTPEALVALGVVQMRQPGQLGAASATLARATMTAPDSAIDYRYQAHAWLALVHLAEDADAALVQGRIATRTAPDSALAHGNLALVYFYTANGGEALREARLAAKLDETSPAAQVALGQALLAQGDAQAAARAAARAVALDEKLPQSWYLLGVADAQLLDYRHAASDLEASLRLAPDFVPAASALARVYTRQGRPQEGVGVLRNLLGRRNDSPVHSALGEVYYEQGRYADSIASYEQANRANPNSALSYAGLARTLLDANRLSEAVVAARNAVRLAPTVGQYHALLGLSYDFNRISFQAEREYRAAIALDSQNALARAMLGLKATDPATTVDTFTQAFLYDPTVSRQMLRGGIRTEITPGGGDEGQRSLNLVHRAIGQEGALHFLGGLGRSREKGDPLRVNDTSSQGTYRQDTTYIVNRRTSTYFNLLHATAKQGLSGLSTGSFGPDPDAGAAVDFDQGLFAVRHRMRAGNYLWLGLAGQRLRNEVRNESQPFPLPFPLPLNTAFPFTGQTFKNRAVIAEMRTDFSLSHEPRYPSTLTFGAASARLRPSLSTGLLASITPSQPIAVFPPATHRTRERFTVAYAQWARRPNDRLSFVAQLRHQRDERATTSQGGTGPLSNETRDSQLLPSLLTTYQINNKIMLRFLSTDKSRTTNLAIAPGETRLTVEPDILRLGQTDRSRVTELNIESNLSPRRFFKVFLFHASARNLALGNDAPVFAFRVVSPIVLTRLQQDGLGFRYEQRLNRNLYSSLGLLMNRSSNRTPGASFDGETAPYYPDRTASAALNYVDGRGNKATLIANYSGGFFQDRPSFLGLPAETDRPRFPAHVYMSLLYAKEPSVKTEIFAGLTNLFNSPAIQFNGVPVVSDNFGSGRRRFFGGVTRRF